ncbi:MAG: DNA mismatch repair endonuclease MutL, partial [Symbiobacteriaceae bacterium]|nr:DNA mismatch repair endonuclease MutL [Symbiobacteriaceae bacterium]
VATEVIQADGQTRSGDTAAPAGTSIKVEDLFYNTPARLKFMRSERAESLAIAEVMEHLSLVSPAISMELIQDDRLHLRTTGSGDLADVALAIYGRVAIRSFIPISASGDDLALQGLISLPTLTKASRGHIHWILNGRYIQSRSFLHAMEEAYRNLLPHKRYPLGIIYLQLPLDQVDVNVHPAKTEVRIRDEGRVYGFILNSLRQTLAQATAENQIPASADFQRPGSESSLQLKLPPAPSDDRVARLSAAIYPGERISEVRRSDTYYPPILTADEGAHGQSIFPPFRVISQLAGTFILAQCASAWLVVDQHAAHERILFEKMMASLQDGNLSSQMLLYPLALTLSLREEALMTEYSSALGLLGFSFEAFGEHTVLLRSVPHLIGESSGEEALRELLGELTLGGKEPELEQLVDKALITLSCHGAVKANTWLTIANMEELLRDLGSCAHASTCPHGRPVYHYLALDDLNKWFART